jgi:hypothetical protein
VRRACFDLIGLPPTIEQLDQVLADESANWYEDFLDRLLDSPHYGERWGRHWLDVAGYADSEGAVGDRDRPHAYRYRDYVIRSFNADKPIDQFVREQLAGDELAGPLDGEPTDVRRGVPPQRLCPVAEDPAAHLHAGVRRTGDGAQLRGATGHHRGTAVACADEQPVHVAAVVELR